MINQNKTISKPKRVIFNFLEKCNMSCPFCYCPFDGIASNIEIWRNIINRFYEWKVESVTFGGGDPFHYKKFPKLLEFAKFANHYIPFVQVDTNGLCLSSRQPNNILDKIDLLGLPLDGPSARVHASIRGLERHYHHVLGLLENFTRIGIAIKINTVVCSKNIEHLDKMAALLKRYKIAAWALYEFWELKDTPSSTFSKYSVPTDLFIQIAERIKTNYDFTIVEIGTVHSRKSGYFFVSQTGRVYTIDREDHRRQVFLGSVFDNDILDRWGYYVESIETANARLKNRIEAVKKIISHQPS